MKHTSTVSIKINNVEGITLWGQDIEFIFRRWSGVQQKLHSSTAFDRGISVLTAGRFYMEKWKSSMVEWGILGRTHFPRRGKVVSGP